MKFADWKLTLASLVVLFCLESFVQARENSKHDSPESPNQSNVTSEKILASVNQALPFIKTKGIWWMEKKECMSCHRTSFMAWSHVEADLAGIATDRAETKNWIDWNHANLFDEFPEKDQKYPGEQTIVRNLSGAAQMLWVASRSPERNPSDEDLKQIVDFLRKGQQASGGWDPKGQLPGQRRDLKETAQVITHWNALGLSRAKKSGLISSDEIELMLVAARKFSQDYSQGTTSEWLALKSVWEADFGQPERLRDYVNSLMSHQNEDGGWGWKTDETSDVLATGQVLYLCQEINELAQEVLIPESTLEKAVAFLLKRQHENGSWKVPGTKTSAKGRIQETATYWGTCWATMALSRYYRRQNKDLNQVSKE